MWGSGRQKQRPDLLSSSAASLTQTKATISSLPELGPGRLVEQARLCANVLLCLLQHPTLVSFLSVYTLYTDTANNMYDFHGAFMKSAHYAVPLCALVFNPDASARDEMIYTHRTVSESAHTISVPLPLTPKVHINTAVAFRRNLEGVP